jgi:hypothetical protein
VGHRARRQAATRGSWRTRTWRRRAAGADNGRAATLADSRAECAGRHSAGTERPAGRAGRRSRRVCAAGHHVESDDSADRTHQPWWQPCPRRAEQRIRYCSDRHRRRACRAPRQGPRCRDQHGEAADGRRLVDVQHPRWRGRGERSDRPRGAAARRSRDRRVRAERDRPERLAGHHPQRRVADQLRHGDRQPLWCDGPGGGDTRRRVVPDCASRSSRRPTPA